MTRLSGTSRLALFLGAVAMALWLFFMGFWVVLFGGPVEGFKLLGKYYVAGAVGSFLVAFFLVQGVAWVFRGFTQSE